MQACLEIAMFIREKNKKCFDYLFHVLSKLLTTIFQEKQDLKMPDYADAFQRKIPLRYV